VDGLDRIEELCKEVYLICAEKGVQNEHVVEKVLGGGGELEALREMGLELVKERVRREGVDALSGWEAARGQFLRYSELLTTAETEGIVGELEGARLDQVGFVQEVLGGRFGVGEGEEIPQLPDGTAAEFEGDAELRRFILTNTEVVLKTGQQGVRTILEAGEQRHAELMAAIERLRRGQSELLTQVVAQGHFLRSHSNLPHFMYIADERGRFTRLRDVLSRMATLHLLCEGGRMPHVVIDQSGKEFQVSFKKDSAAHTNFQGPAA
jgi:hypothetical protein